MHYALPKLSMLRPDCQLIYNFFEKFQHRENPWFGIEPNFSNEDLDDLFAKVAWVELCQYPSDSINELKEKSVLADYCRDLPSRSVGWWIARCFGPEMIIEQERIECNPEEFEFQWSCPDPLKKCLQKFCKSLPFEKINSISIYRVDPGGWVPPHCDDPRADHYDRLIIPLEQPKEAQFWFEHYGRVPFSEGRAYLVNLTNVHTAFNLGQSPRVHLHIRGRFDRGPLAETFTNFLPQQIELWEATKKSDLNFDYKSQLPHLHWTNDDY